MKFRPCAKIAFRIGALGGAEKFGNAFTMKRVSGLDGVRGFAILWVLLYHLFALVPKAPWAAAIPGLGVLAGYGWIGVNLFFALSGYLIIPMLAAQKGDPDYFRRFWCRRAFRLLPVYVLCLLSYLAAASLWPETSPDRARLLDPAIPFWTYWALVQNVWMSARNYLGSEWLRVSWSLALEVQFYALIGVVVYLLPKEHLRRWLVGLTLAVVMFRYGVTFANPSATTPLVLLLPSRLDAFLLGGLTALLPPAGLDRSRLRQGGAATLLVMASVAFEWFAVGGFGRFSRYVLPAYYLLLSIGCVALLDLCANSSPLVRWLMESAPMIRAGKLSYFVYLFHIPIVWTVYHFGSGVAPTLVHGGGVGLMLLVLAVIYGTAELSYRFVEEPLIRRSHGYFRRVDTAAGLVRAHPVS